jgi:hypothetical protein
VDRVDRADAAEKRLEFGFADVVGQVSHVQFSTHDDLVSSPRLTRPADMPCGPLPPSKGNLA